MQDSRICYCKSEFCVLIIKTWAREIVKPLPTFKTLNSVTLPDQRSAEKNCLREGDTHDST